MSPFGPYAGWAALAQEPWGFTPDVLARLTDWQVREVYLRPAGERADEVRRASAGKPTGPPGWDWDRGLPDREAWAVAMAAQFDDDPERFRSDWDRMKAAHDAAQRANRRR